ncbi:MAG TPA: argininosuccinate lyase, partial [bacterium]|nr:argininosuccinate lyase [bacterium]
MIRLVNSRFKKETDKSVLEFTESISFDYKLALYDIEGSIAHTKMLAKCRIITEREKEMIIDGLNKIKEEIINNQFDYKIELEDIHMNIESRLIEMIGEVGKKLHTARSRNDQIALDLRLYVRDMIKEISKQIIELLIKINKLAGEHIKIIMPGFTHLQPAQPILLSHWLLAYFEKFKRDYIKLKDCYKEVNLCPLGAAALAGTTYKIDREYVAKILGFDGITENSIDSVSDRDFIAHYLFVLSMIGVHFSQISEELIIWSNPYFNFIEIDDGFTTGSSIMPNKKNPDVCELIRAKTGRLFGNLQNILTILKGLPQAYNRDLQEDKIPLFDSTETVIKIIDVYTKM